MGSDGSLPQLWQFPLQASPCLAGSPSCKLFPLVCKVSWENRAKIGIFIFQQASMLSNLKNRAKLSRNTQRLHMPLLENMSHELAELHFPLPAAPSATFTSLWIGNETRFQEVSPLFPNVLWGRLHWRSSLCHNTSFCAFSHHGFGFCAWVIANI